MERNGEKERFDSESGNVRLLWHGSRTEYVPSILKNGLLIAPRGSILTGQMFGKGVYFADMAGESLKYTHGRKGESVFLLLAEVALGQSLPTSAPMKTRLGSQPEYQSVKAIGVEDPDPAEHLQHNGMKNVLFFFSFNGETKFYIFSSRAF